MLTNDDRSHTRVWDKMSLPRGDVFYLQAEAARLVQWSSKWKQFPGSHSADHGRKVTWNNHDGHDLCCINVLTYFRDRIRDSNSPFTGCSRAHTPFVSLVVAQSAEPPWSNLVPCGLIALLRPHCVHCLAIMSTDYSVDSSQHHPACKVGLEFWLQTQARMKYVSVWI